MNQPLGDDLASPVYVKTMVREDGSEAISHFTPITVSQGFTLAKVVTETGRKHQIRAHAHWMGHMMVGDKIYGPDERLYLEFIDHGLSEPSMKKLLLPRQGLHCAEIDLTGAWVEKVFKAPLTEDLASFARNHGLLP